MSGNVYQLRKYPCTSIYVPPPETPPQSDDDLCVIADPWGGAQICGEPDERALGAFQKAALLAGLCAVAFMLGLLVGGGL